ncbi:MAG: amino acid adenylation domain-containing protein [Chloroflexi bacterium]|nr:amino acid adenylation domain-containing protein [Chloroflexota bacterium]
MTTGNIQAIYPLTPTQEGMLFHVIQSPNSGVYVQQLICELDGELNRDAFTRAWEMIANRHAALRTLFTWEKRDQPLQIVRERVELDWQIEDWSSRDPAEQDARLEEILRADRAQGFELTRAPLMRLRLIRTAPHAHRFVWSYSHLIMDGWSTYLVLREVLACYDALCRGETFSRESPRPFQDYIRWLAQRDHTRAESFWRAELRGLEAPTKLEIESRTTGEAGYIQTRVALSAETSAALQTFAQSNRVTLNTLIQAAWAILLNRYSGADEVLFGVTMAGRPFDLDGAEKMIGMFINTLPLRVAVDAAMPLDAWLEQLQARNVALREYEHTSLAKIRAWSEMQQQRALFDTIVVFENYPTEGSLTPPTCNIHLGAIRHAEQSNFPLALLVVPGAAMQLYLIADRARFAPAIVDQLLAHLQTILANMLAHSQQRVGEVEMLTRAELDTMLVEWNNARCDYPRDALMHTLIEQHAAQTPDAPAVFYRDECLTYAELDARANRLANFLRAQGVGANVCVGLCVERSLEMIVGIVGVLQAGGAYVPLDPSYPAERLAFMLSDTHAPVVLTQRRWRDALPHTTARIVCLDADWESIANYPTIQLSNDATSDSLAYIIYTSGSTGKPKGVPITHRHLVHSTFARFAFYPEKAERYLLLSSFAFDSSVAGIFWALAQGGALCLPDQDGEKDVNYVGDLIARWRVTHTLALPSLYHLVLEYAEPGALDSLRVVIVAGESCPAALIQKHYARLPRATLYNEYGPTEGTVWATACAIPPDATQVSIGRPIPNMQAYILDTHLRPVPLGVAGELYIGGDGVAPGYWHREDLTAEKFTIYQFPFSNSPTRLYKTGDLARYRPDGNIDFLGRVDHQVKIRGYRIEVEEIEAAIKQYAGAQDAVVITRDADDGLLAQLEARGNARARQLLDEIEQLG